MSNLIQKITSAVATQTNSQPPLTKEELELLLRMLGNSDFKGRDIEPLYNLVLKLQNMYLAYK